MKQIYKLEFESAQLDKWYQRAVTGINIRNEDIPDAMWEKVSRETDNPWQQYNQLRTWVREDTQAVRNVKLYKMVGEPIWEEVIQ